jgi:hypothetical protein
MLRNRFISISRTGGIKLAGAAKKRRKKNLINADEQQQNPFPDRTQGLPKRIALQVVASRFGSSFSNSLVTAANSAVATDVRG